MHADEVATDVALVRRLVAGPFPDWARLPVEPVASSGTDHALYRLGADKVVRLPRVARIVDQGRRDADWLPRLAPFLPLRIPEPLATAPPAEGFPFPWSVTRWIDGQPATLEGLADPVREAVVLAGFVSALRGIDTSACPGPRHYEGRAAPLQTRDDETRAAIAELDGMFDRAALTAVWERALRAPAPPQKAVWLHGDLLPSNLLADRGRLVAVIDFGAMGVGDPTCDLLPAWTLFAGASRAAFRTALRVDDATWERGRGWALSWAAIFIPYYLHTNPVGVAVARRTIEQVLADRPAGRAGRPSAID
jgi:aminoglycoside phosphotransferase (APT) family kinase protein